MPARATQKKTAGKKASGKKDASYSYEKYKMFRGKQYTGMAVGRSHKWYYDKGEWRETKVTPDRWEISYHVTKRRAGKAPEGSGVPVGTGYHWFILAHQFVHKLNADDYSTDMKGIKLKLAHKRASKGKWNISEETQKKHLIQMLEEVIAGLKAEPEKFDTIPLKFRQKDKLYDGFAVPMMDSCSGGICRRLDITLNDKHYGKIRLTKDGWRMTNVKPQSFVTAIGDLLMEAYGRHA